MEKTLLERIEECNELTKRMMAGNPMMTGMWFAINDIEVHELRAVAKMFNKEIRFNEQVSCMTIHGHDFGVFEATIFCYSVKVKQAFIPVNDTAYVNI